MAKATSKTARKVIITASRFGLLQTVTLLLVVISVSTIGIKLLTGSHAAANFTTNSGGQIIDPDGKVFTPIGINLNGPHSVWDEFTPSTTDLVGMAGDTWKFNTIRLDSAVDSGQSDYPQYNYGNDSEFDTVVNAYTARHMVVIIGNFTVKACTMPTPGQVGQITSYWTGLANKYKNNPYVWFDLQNEPGGDAHEQQWLDDHNTWSQAIRATGAQNMISYEGGTCGQEEHYGKGDWASASNFFAWGPQLKSAYGNVSFQLHVYGDWETGDMVGFITAMRTKGLGMYIGEIGWPEGSNGVERNGSLNGYAAAKSTGTGVLGWHGMGGDGYNITTGSSGAHFNNINSTTNPSNLTEDGQLLWNYSHYLAGIAPLAPAPPPAPPAPPAPSTPGSYNDTALTYNGGWQISTGTGKYNGDDHYSSNANDTATLQFTGAQQIKMYGAKGPTYGQVSFSIDGGAATTVDLYSATRTDDVVIFTNPAALSTGTHTIKVTVLGTKNVASADSVVSLDQVDVLATFSGGATPPVTTPPVTTPPTGMVYSAGPYNDSAFTYAGTGWQMSTGTDKYNSDDHYSNTAGDTAKLSFTGTELKMYGAQAPHGGKVAISMDGGAEITYDLYAATRLDQYLFYTSPALANGTHNVSVRVTGTKNTAATDTVVSLDKVVISAVTSVPTTVPGDVDGDGHVNTKDIAILLKNWNQTVPVNTNGDLNGDGHVTSVDIAILLKNWGR
jgi:mannan endo-1,4-beta-mannosidase